MRQHKTNWILVVALFSLMLVSAGVQAQETVLYDFAAASDGGYPVAGLILDASGNLYGTTSGGGSSSACGSTGCGVVFELTPNAGTWKQTVIHNFAGGSDGSNPQAALVMDAAGNLYGTTVGENTTCTPAGSCGTVFELTPNGTGGWTESVIYSFKGGTDGIAPNAALIIDSSGNLYGTTYFGGVSSCYANVGCGTVFQLHPDSGGGWTEKVLHRFVGGSDGAFLRGGLVFDHSGNLYGTTESGGSRGCFGNGCGTIFRLNRYNGWSELVLDRFTGGSDGNFLDGSLIFDGVSSFYGTTLGGGDTSCVIAGELPGCGTVFQLTHSTSGWTKTILHNFSGGIDGSTPLGGLTFDSNGDLYGTTNQGGSTGCYGSYGCGTIFELSPSQTGWNESVVYVFSGGADGSNPQWVNLAIDSANNLYGTTQAGGNLTCPNSGFGCGTVFQWSPQ